MLPIRPPLARTVTISEAAHPVFSPLNWGLSSYSTAAQVSSLASNAHILHQAALLYSFYAHKIDLGCFDTVCLDGCLSGTYF